MLAHSLSGLAIQLQGARKLAGREAVSESLRATIDRSAELTKAGPAALAVAVGLTSSPPPSRPSPRCCCACCSR